MVFTGHDDERDADLAALRDQIGRLQAELRTARAETAAAKRQAEQALSALRKQLSPLYRALQSVFGELDAAGVEDTPVGTSAVSSRIDTIWASWKSKFPGKPSMIIDALMVHGQMSISQIAIAIRSDRRNVPPMLSKLKGAGLLEKNGSMFSLKQL